jgi:hypothetical protein
VPTFTGERPAASATAAGSPRSVSTWGWTPRISSRSSASACLACSWAVSSCRGGRARRQVEPGQAEGHGERDQPLLGAVVQVALDPPPVQLERVHQAGPRPGDLDQPPVQLQLPGDEDRPGQRRPGPGPGGDRVRGHRQQGHGDGEHGRLGAASRGGAAQRHDREAGREEHGEHDHGQVDQPQHDHADDAEAGLQGPVPGPLGPPPVVVEADVDQPQAPALVPGHDRSRTQQGQRHQGQDDRRGPRAGREKRTITPAATAALGAIPQSR